MKKIIFIICIILLTGCVDKNNYEKEKEFLTSGLISKESVIGSGYPAGYYLSKDGTFSYYVGEYEKLDSNSKVSYRGTWEIKDGDLILYVEETEYNKNPNDIWDDLEVKEESYEVVFKDIELKDNYLFTGNGKLYSLKVEDGYIDIFKALNKSYDDYYLEKNNYYNSI